MQSIKSNSEKNLLMSQVSMFEMICKKCAIHQNLLTQQTCQATRSKVIPCISNYIALHNDTDILQELFWNVCLQVYNVIVVCVHGSSVPPLGCCRQWLFWILTQRVTFETWLTWCNDKKIKIWQIKRQQGKKRQWNTLPDFCPDAIIYLCHQQMSHNKMKMLPMFFRFS